MLDTLLIFYDCGPDRQTRADATQKYVTFITFS